MSFFASALVAWSATYASTVAYALSRVVRPSVPKKTAIGARVLLVRPCSGLEPNLKATLASSALDADLLRVRVRFAVASADDEAYAVARQVADALATRGYDANVVVTAARAPNRKADQIARTLATAPPHDVVVVCDSDVLLAPGDLHTLVARVGDEGIAAAWSPPVEWGHPLGVGDLVSRSVLCATLHAFPLLAGLDRAGLVGKLFAIRSAALEEVGSFAGLLEYLGEDMELARRLRAQGMHVVCCGIARACRRGRTAAEAVDRYARWIGVIRSQRPHLLWTYPAFFFSPLPLAIVAAVNGLSLAAILFLVPRLAVGLFAAPGRWRSPVRAVFESVLGDGVLAVAFFRALATRTVSWRGTTLRIKRNALELDHR